jgi:hypothetical protein
MEEVIFNIMQLLQAAMPGLSLIDEDYGQLETEEDTYPVTFPCVLIGNNETDWQTLSNNAQRGDVSLTVRLAIDCYDDTRMGSNTEELIASRLKFAAKVYTSLQGQRVSVSATKLNRTKSRSYGIAHGIKVYDTMFSFRFMDESLYS